jgi:hypothetical protein
VYERRIEHSLYRTMAEFRKQRLLREMEPPAGATLEGGWAGSTGILPVSSMGVPPMTTEDIHGQDARDTHGRDAHATRPPEGGTPNESCETNPIPGGVSSLRCEVASEQSQASNPPASNLTLPTSDSAIRTGDELPAGVATNVPQVPELSCETNPISAGSNAGGTPNGTGGQEPSCETNPISGAAKKDPVSYVHIFHRRR